MERMLGDESELGLLVRSHERPAYLRRCLDSLAAAELAHIAVMRIHDDASSDPRTLALLERAEGLGFTISRSERRLGQPSMRAALAGFPDVDFICSLDNDMIVKPNFATALLATYQRIRAHHGLGRAQLLLTGFNCTAGPRGGHPTIDDTARSEGYVEKSSCGGASLFFHRSLRADVIHWWAEDAYYDWGVVHGLLRRGGRIFATTPSVAQHIGEYGDNSDGVCDRAEDF